MQHSFYWFQLDDLAFKLLLLGLALVLALLFAFAIFLWLWQRQRRTAKREKSSHLTTVTEEGQNMKQKHLKSDGTSNHHFDVGKNNKSDTFFVIPIEQCSNVAQSQSQPNAGLLQQQHKLSRGFAAFFQGSPPRTPKNHAHQMPPLTPSPLNAIDYLDLEDGIIEAANVSKNIIRINHHDDHNHDDIDTKMYAVDIPKKTDSNGKNKKGSRKDSVRPANGLQIAQEIKQEDKLMLKNRPFKILVNDDGYEKEQQQGENNATENYKHPATGSPLMMRRFMSTMEKVPESENERLYGEFETLNQQSMCTLRSRSSSAELPENIRKNRFYDILPFDFNRVKLQWQNTAYGGTDGHSSDFINASYVKTDDGNVTYIAAQGPIGPEEIFDGRRVTTVRHFWEMIWQEQVNCIVMLTQIKEGIKQKCAHYWPDSPGESDQIGPDFSVHLYCVTEDEICFQRELWLQRTGHPQRKIIQWHYKDWRDASGPTEVENLLVFIESIRASTKKHPIMVHCSAGVGRTGVFIALDILLNKLAKEHIIDVKDTVRQLRLQRTNMVQNAEQYVALYEAVAQAICRKSRAFG